MRGAALQALKKQKEGELVGLDEALNIVSSGIPVEEYLLESLYEEFATEYSMNEAFIGRDAIPPNIFASMVMGGELSNDQILRCSRRENLSVDDMVLLLAECSSSYMFRAILGNFVISAARNGIDGELWLLLASKSSSLSIESVELSKLSGCVSPENLTKFLDDDLGQSHKYYELYEYDEGSGYSFEARQAVDTLVFGEHTRSETVRVLCDSPIFQFRMQAGRATHVPYEHVDRLFCEAWVMFMEGKIEGSDFLESLEICLGRELLTSNAVRAGFQVKESLSEERQIKADSYVAWLLGFGEFDRFFADLIEDDISGLPVEWVRELFKVQFQVLSA